MKVKSPTARYANHRGAASRIGTELPKMEAVKVGSYQRDELT